MKTSIHPEWRPTRTPEEVAAVFPLIDPKATLLSFVAHNLDKGYTSHDWDAAFHNFCDHRQRQAADKADGQRHTDSMGFPLGMGNKPLPGEGQSGVDFLDVLRKYQNDGHDFATARALAEAEMTEGETDG